MAQGFNLLNKFKASASRCISTLHFGKYWFVRSHHITLQCDLNTRIFRVWWHKSPSTICFYEYVNFFKIVFAFCSHRNWVLWASWLWFSKMGFLSENVYVWTVWTQLFKNSGIAQLDTNQRLQTWQKSNNNNLVV